MEFAVIETGGKQYKVSEKEAIRIERIPGEFKNGDTIVFDKVLLFDDGKDTQVGTPYLEGKTVTGKFEEEGRNAKIDVIKFKQKSRYFKKRGHRQDFFKVVIESIK